MYHRIINPESEPIPQLPGMYVRPDTFRMHLEYLTKHFKIIPLENLIANYSEKLTTREKYIALTFDDAWIDFKTNALPILEEFNAPATVFVPTKFIDTGELFWNDIIQIALQKGLDLNNLLNNDQIKLTTDPNSLIESLKNDRNSRNLLTKELKEILNNELSSIPSQFLSWDDIRNISEKGLITFGSHSHSHEISTQISIAEFMQDISVSIENFKKALVPLHNVFCYPNQNGNESTDRILATLDFTKSLSLNHSDFSMHRTGIHQDISKDSGLLSLAINI